ncbi:hypothetical protein SRHO_G00060630 [Serrasalmus rhombeus]
MSLQSTFEDSKRFCCSDSQWEFIPPPGCQYREHSRHLSSMHLEGWRVKPSCTRSSKGSWYSLRFHHCHQVGRGWSIFGFAGQH